MGTHCSSELHRGHRFKSTFNMQAFLLTSLAAVAMASTPYGAPHHPAPYSHPTAYGHPAGRYGRSAESEPAPAPEAKPLVPLYGLKHNLVYPYTALPAVAHPALVHPYAHPYALPYAHVVAPAVVPKPVVVAAPAAPAPNDPTAPAAWTAAHPAGLAHESVAGGLRTNHGDATSYVFQSNVV